VIEDADSSLLVIDTGGWFRISCPSSKVAKPEVLGAIYRIRRSDSQSASDPRGLLIDWNGKSSTLVSRLDDRRPVVRDRAIDLFSRRGDAAVPPLARALKSLSIQKRRNAVWALSRIETAIARQSILMGLSDADPTVRQAAVRSVGTLSLKAAVPRLIEILSNDTDSVRQAVATALGQIGDRKAVEPLLEAAGRGGDDFLMRALVYALIEIGDFERTAQGLTGSSARVQQSALVAMNQMDPGRINQGHVSPLLESDDIALRRTALDIVTNRDGWSDQIIQFLSEWTKKTKINEAETKIARGAVAAFAADKRVQQIIGATMDATETACDKRFWTPSAKSIPCQAHGLNHSRNYSTTETTKYACRS